MNNKLEIRFTTCHATIPRVIDKLAVNMVKKLCI